MLLGYIHNLIKPRRMTKNIGYNDGFSMWAYVSFDRGRVELLEQSGAESGPADDRDASEVVLRPGHDQ